MLTDAFQQLKTNLELTPRFNELVQQRQNSVRDYLHNNHLGVVDTKLIGSVRRKTRIQPLTGGKFDIDILIVMGSFYNWLPVGALTGITPQKALSDLRRSVASSDRYGAMNPQEEPPTITVEYSDATVVEFVPGYLDQIGASSSGLMHSPKGRAYWVPVNGRWELADYDYDADYFSDQNGACGGWLIPTIKMLKAIKRGYFSTMRSFHLDIIAAAIIPISVASRKSNGAEVSYPTLIRDFFNYAPSQLSLTARIPGSHSTPMTLTQPEIATLTDTFQKIRAYIDSFQALPQESKQREGWKFLFGTPFPA
ncbi:MAG: SMODS domain-containing nucleotidyltransferase [Acidobacteriota bacterium]